MAFLPFLLQLVIVLLCFPLPGLTCRDIDCGAGFCIEEGGGKYVCVCITGYEGEKCEKPVPVVKRSTEEYPCTESSCKNGGTCVPLPSGEAMMIGEASEIGEVELDCEDVGMNCSYSCLCVPGFTGPTCATPNFCPTIETAGIVWERTVAGSILAKTCESVDTALSGTNVIRKCSVDSVWEEPEFTRCTLGSGSSPFILLWVVAKANNGEEFEGNLVLNQLDNMVMQMLGPNSQLTRSQTFPLYKQDAPFRVFFTYKIVLARNASIADVSSSFNGRLEFSVNITQASVTVQSQGYKGFFPSASCSCIETANDLKTLCTSVNNNDHTSPCTCSLLTGGCQCQGPFYVGNGVECAVDTDGDGYPNTPLPSCSKTSTEMYCSEDICPLTYYSENTAFPCEADSEELLDFEGCPGGEDVWGFIWPNVENDEDVEVTCPDGQGSATRSCVNGEWEPAQVLECGSSDFGNALTEAEAVFDNDDKDLAERLNTTAAIMQEVLELIQPREGLSHLPGDLNSTNAIVSGVLQLLEDTLIPGNHVIGVPPQSVFRVFNTALHPNNAQGWISLQNATGGASKLLDSMERYGLYRSRAASDRESREVSQDENIVLGVIRYSSSSNSSSVTFPKSLNELRNTSFSNGINAQITIPSSLLMERKAAGENTAPVAGTIARGMEIILLPTSLGETWSVASQVISAQVAERSVRSSIPVNATFTFNSVVNASEYRCAYWNFSNMGSNGVWAFDGVKVVTNVTSDGTTVVTCESTHLTSFAVLVNAADGVNDLSSAELQALMVVSYIGCAISLACLSLAIIYYITIWKELLAQVHYFIHLNLAVALFLAYLVFVLGIQLARENEGACIFVAALLQYLFLSAFCWMMCEGIMLYLMLVVVFSKLAKKWWFFMLLGWVPALLPVIIGLAARHKEYGVENDRGELEYCWLSTNKGVIWAFIIPMLAIIIINTFFLVIALVKVFQTKRRQTYKMKPTATIHFNLFKTLFRATVVLLPILGLTWVFGLFAVNQNSSWLAWLFTIFNTLQGCFIFVVHVVLSDKFWKNSRVKRLRRYVSTSVKSSHFGSTVYSTIRRSNTYEGSGNTLKLSKYSTSGVAKIDDDDKEINVGVVVSNAGSSEKELESAAEPSEMALAKAKEAAKD